MYPELSVGAVVMTNGDGERPMLTAPRFRWRLLPESDTSFVASTLGWRVTFTLEASGRAKALTVFRENGPPFEGARVP